MNKNLEPFVSIVIPSFNHASYIQKAIESVNSQEYKNWEILVIDNNSTDSTVEILSGDFFKNIRVMSINNGGIIAKSRNFGIKEAKGSWIAFLDSDDLWDRNKLKVCISYINDAVDVIYHDLRIISTSSHSFKKIKSRALKKPALIDLMVRGNTIATSSLLVRASKINEISGMNESPSMIGAEDYNTWLRLAAITENFVYIPEVLGSYLQHTEGVSSKKNMAIATRFAGNQFFNSLDSSQKKKHLAYIRYEKGRYLYRTGNYQASIRNLIFVLKNGRPYIVFKSAIVIIVSFFASLV